MADTVVSRQLKFGVLGTDNVTLTSTEQFTQQIGLTEFPQHAFQFVYSPGVTNDANVYLEVRVYGSLDGIDILDSVTDDNNKWSALVQYVEVSGSAGEKSPEIKVYRQPAIAANIATRSPIIQLPMGLRKVKFSVKEAGSPSSAGTITEAHLSSRRET